MKRECYLCHKIIEDEMITKCPACQSEILFPIKEQETIKTQYESPSVKIVIGGDVQKKEKRKIKLPSFSLPKFNFGNPKKDEKINVEQYNVTNKQPENLKISNPDINSIELVKLHKRFDSLENLININAYKCNSPPQQQNIINIDELINYQTTTQMLIIILIIMVFLFFIILLI